MRNFATLLNPSIDAKLRIVLGCTLAVQGAIRVLNALLPIMHQQWLSDTIMVPSLTFGSDVGNGLLMLVIGSSLLITNRRRTSGALAATLAAAFWLWLAHNIWSNSAPSAAAATINAAVMFIEARAGAWKRGT